MVIKLTKTRKELKIGIIIETEIEDDYDFNDIGELIAADIEEIYQNGEDFIEVFYRGVEDYEDF